jgi:[ribosomal protein S5]-alanine N-acetyltransferase
LRAPRSARLDAEAPDLELHLEFARRQFADPRVARWHWPGGLGGPRTRAQTRELVARQARECAEHGFGLWWWRERGSGELVGQAGLNRTDVEGEPVVEVGWSISPARWGEGFAPEAAGASLVWGWKRAGLEEIVAFTLPDNLASRRVMDKLGMSYVRDFEREGLPHVLYRARRPIGPDRQVTDT